jgi:hypothetical protein
MLNAIEQVSISVNTNTVAMSSFVGSDTIHKSVLGATVDGLSRQRGNGSLQWVRSLHQCSYVRYGCGPNGPMARFLVIIVVLTVRERRSNGHNDSNGYIAPPW